MMMLCGCLGCKNPVRYTCEGGSCDCSVWSTALAFTGRYHVLGRPPSPTISLKSPMRMAFSPRHSPPPLFECWLCP